MSKKFIHKEDSLPFYLREVKNHDMVSAEEEKELARRWREEGDVEAKDRLINAHLRFVISVAKTYQGNNLPLNDLINEGNYGLCKAIERYDYKGKIKFISYAVWWIRQCILQALCENSREIRLPVNIINQISKQKKIAKDEFGLNVDTFMGGIEVPVEIHTPHVVSLNDVINDDDDTELGDVIMADKTSEADVLVNDPSEKNRMVMEILNKLNEREREIIILYHGLRGDTPMTLEEIGKEESIDLTKERVRQIMEVAKKKLRRHAKSLFDAIE